MRLPHELESLRPDLLVVCIFAGNDFGDLIRNRLYRIDDDGALMSNEFQIGPGMRSEFAHASNPFMLYKLASRWLRRFEKVDEDLPTPDDSAKRKQDRFTEWLQVSVAEYEQFVLDGDNTVEGWGSDRYDGDVSAMPNSDSARYKKKLMQAVLGRIQRISSDARIPLLVVIIPSFGDVCDRSDVIEVNTQVYPDYRRAALTDAVAHAAEELGIMHVDLFGTLRRPDAESYYRIFDDHWNAAGQQLCAEVVADYIDSRELLGRDRKVATVYRENSGVSDEEVHALLSKESDTE